MIINRLDFLQRVQIDPPTLAVWLAQGWLLPCEIVTEMKFSEIDLSRAQLILDLQQDLGINDEGIGVILDLVDQVYGLRRLVAGLLPPDSANAMFTGPTASL